MTHNSSELVQHPRVLELAKFLKGRDIDWGGIQTGDWIFADDAFYVIMRIETKGDKTYVYGQKDVCFESDKVTLIPHLTQCREWLMARDYDLQVEDTQSAQVKAIAHRRQTDFRIERVEPNEMAAVYAVIAEVLDLGHFGWA